MVGDILQPTHLLFILIVALLVLGPKRLPEVARTLGEGLRDFRSAISGERDDDSPPGVRGSHDDYASFDQHPDEEASAVPSQPGATDPETRTMPVPNAAEPDAGKATPSAEAETVEAPRAAQPAEESRPAQSERLG